MRRKASPLTDTMCRAIVELGRWAHGATASTIGEALVGNRARLPQRSAREGGRTLRALQRRHLAVGRYDTFFGRWLWKLTPAGERERARMQP